MEPHEVYKIVERLEDKIDVKFSELWNHLGVKENECRTRHEPLVADMAVLKRESSNRAAWISIIISAVFVAAKMIFDSIRGR